MSEADSDLRDYVSVKTKPFAPFLEANKNLGTIKVAEFDKIIKETMEQANAWQIKWLFSPWVKPNVNAKTEWNGWRTIWQSFIEAQEKQAAGIKKTYEDQFELLGIQNVAEWNIDYAKDKPFRRRLNDTLGNLSKFAYKIRLSQIAYWLTNHQLFPKWTVGFKKHADKDPAFTD